MPSERGAVRAAADTTRQRLLRAAEQLFAEQGVDGARTRDITERAGQANSSALHYHFGSRKGLLAAILERHQTRVERELTTRLQHLGPTAAREGDEATELTALIAAYIEAEASELAHDSGRDCLRIVTQLAHETGFRDGTPHEALSGGALWDVFTRIATLLKAEDAQAKTPSGPPADPAGSPDTALSPPSGSGAADASIGGRSGGDGVPAAMARSSTAGTTTAVGGAEAVNSLCGPDVPLSPRVPSDPHVPLLPRLPDALAKERVELMVMLVGSAFADRARHVQAGRPRPVGGAAFRADLVRVVVAMVTAPGP